MIEKITFTEDALKEITRIIKKGNTAEVKKEQNKIVIVEIERHARIKEPING